MIALHFVLAALLLACLADWPYGYYQFVRWAAMVGFAILALNYYRRGQESLAVLLVGLALLFQPFVKVALERTGWNAVDVVVGVLLIALAVRHRSVLDH